MPEDIKPYLKAVKRATQMNEHTYARKLIAMYVKRKHNRLDGVDKLEKYFDAITLLQDGFYKHLPEELNKVRKDIEAATFSFLSVEEAKQFNENL